MTINRDRRAPADADDTVGVPRHDATSDPTRPAQGGPALFSAGVATVLVVAVLGLVARVGAVARDQLSIDRDIAADRTGWLTSVAHLLTASATPEITGIVVAIGLPVVLFLLRRRIAAVQALCVMGGALALALVAKSVIGEHRPPALLWALPADSGASYPSGHTTVAAAIIVALVVVARTGTWRAVAVIVGGVYVLAVAASRVYVANHYPLDVVGSVLCAVAAALVVIGLSRLPAVSRQLSRLEASPAR